MGMLILLKERQKNKTSLYKTMAGSVNIFVSNEFCQ
jgi:hypothetical protein